VKSLIDGTVKWIGIGLAVLSLIAGGAYSQAMSIAKINHNSQRIEELLQVRREIRQIRDVVIKLAVKEGISVDRLP
jgi:hypothetical protein